MTGNRPPREFGKRRPQPLSLPPKDPVKRSGHVALLVMGTIAVGTTAYTLMPRASCDSSSPGMAAPAPQDTACSGRSSSGASGGSTHRYSFFSNDSAGHSSSGTTSDSGSGGVTRGGFGSFAHAFGFSGHG